MQSLERQPAQPDKARVDLSRPPAETDELARRRKRRGAAHARNRHGQQDGHRGRREWREAPATREQITALRRIAMESGHTYTLGVTRGEAWRRIEQATRLVEEPLRLACAPPWHHTRGDQEAKAA